MDTEGHHRYHPFDASPHAATNLDSNREPVLTDHPLHDRDRRDVPDRRKVTRNGRRASDPRPQCLSAILISGRRHTSEAEGPGRALPPLFR